MKVDENICGATCISDAVFVFKFDDQCTGFTIENIKKI